jgi:L-2-hydroxyglutarate oxidase
MSDNFEIVIVGGGIVGLATAYNLLLQSPKSKIAVLEKEAAIAAHQTSRNSGVIHSGIYYKPGSLKALNCRRGYDLLIDFCKKQNVPFELCGKVIVATDSSQLPQLAELKARAIANKLDGVEYLSVEKLKEIEPHCQGVQALWVPQTGIISYKSVAVALAAEIRRLGGQIILNCRVQGIVRRGSETSCGAYSTQKLVNCAGLFCDRIAKMAGEKLDVQIVPFRGEYFELRKEKENLVRNLIYPVPNPAFPFLGVHFTRMKEGGIEVGPNAVLAFKREGYGKTDFSFFDSLQTLLWPGFRKIVSKYWRDGLGELHRSLSKKAFLKAAQALMPELELQDLVPARAGVRAQACHLDGRLIDDFLIVESPGMLHLLNAPSPAATASLAIGETLASRILGAPL